MVKNLKRKKISFNQPKIFSQKKEREQKRSYNPLPLLRFLLILITLCLLTYFLLFSSFFKVNVVIIEGNKLVEKDRIEKLVSKGENIFLLNKNELIQEIIGNIPEVNDIQIYKGIPNALKVVVLEHNQSIIWKSDGKSYLISSEGYAYRDVTDKIGDYSTLPRVEDNSNIKVVEGQKIVSPNFVAFIQNIYSVFFTTVNIEPDYFTIKETTFDVDLKTKAGFTVKFDSLRSSKKQLDDLKKVLVEKRDQINEYVDLRIDGWAYYK